MLKPLFSSQFKQFCEDFVFSFDFYVFCTVSANDSWVFLMGKCKAFSKLNPVAEEVSEQAQKLEECTGRTSDSQGAA